MTFFITGPRSVYKVSGLLPKTIYHFRARARNLAGFSDHSNMIILQTNATHNLVGELLGSATTASKATNVISTSIQTLTMSSILLMLLTR